MAQLSSIIRGSEKYSHSLISALSTSLKMCSFSPFFHSLSSIFCAFVIDGRGKSGGFAVVGKCSYNKVLLPSGVLLALMADKRWRNFPLFHPTVCSQHPLRSFVYSPSHSSPTGAHCESAWFLTVGGDVSRGGADSFTL